MFDIKKYKEKINPNPKIAEVWTVDKMLSEIPLKH